MIPKSILKQQTEYEQRIAMLELTVRRQSRMLKAFDEELQASISERLKCLRCRVALRKERESNAGQS